MISATLEPHSPSGGNAPDAPSSNAQKKPAYSSFFSSLASSLALMAPQLRNFHFYLMLLCDAAIFIMACIGAYLLRFEFSLTPEYIQQIENMLLLFVPIKLGAFLLFGLYQGIWRYTSVNDFWRLGQASLVSMLLFLAIIGLFFGFAGVPRSIFILDCALTFIMAGGLRMGIRSYYAAVSAAKGLQAFSIPTGRTAMNRSKRVVIIGAGDSGEKMLREIFDNPHLDYTVVGFLDDDPGKLGRAVHGVPILGGVGTLPEIIDRFSVHQVFISVPSATGAELRRIIDTCKSCEVSYKTLPGIGEIIDGKVSIKALREVNYADLLRRQPVRLDTAGIKDYLTGRTVMVTGAGGSIGSELCRQLVRFNPENLILLDASEENLFHIEMELRHELNYDSYKCILGRVQHRMLMEEVFSRYRPQVVFHAAAYKHVPMIETNLWEAIHNNVHGSQVVMEMAVKFGVRRFVLVSTDKAVRPTNVMGASKRLTELIMHSLQGNGTTFRAVRFGNVVGSSGSVIPLFRRQIEHGGPVTVTHPEVTRYFMTIPEAAQLILQAGALQDKGEIFILEMGTPVKIAEMAEDLIRLSGKSPGKDIEITFIGLRPGEKLYEELITHGENIVSTEHQKIMVLKSNGNGNGKREEYRDWLNGQIQELLEIAGTHDACAIKRKLNTIVPEYMPQEGDASVLHCRQPRENQGVSG